MDLFDKCLAYTRADDAKAQGIYPYFRPISENEGPVVTIQGRQVIMAGSNNYLGLTADPRVQEAAKRAIDTYGTGCSGSRYLTGTIDLHVELEEKLADYFQKEAVLLFSTGYQTGLGVIPSLVQRGEYIISDRDNHACIVSATLMARGATAELARYKHNNMDDLERVISKLPEEAPKLIATDGVFSTGGEIVDLPRLVEIAKKYNARLLVDDAHAVGVIGPNGRGTAHHFGLNHEVDMTMGTFSKTFASLGGFVAGPERVINYIKHVAPALIFSASPTPSSVAATLKALEIMEEEPWRVSKVVENAAYVRNALINEGFEVLPGETAIVPVIVGSDEKAFIMGKALFDAGVFVNVFITPGVPNGRQMMRTSYMSTHEPAHLDRIVEAFVTVGRKLGLIGADRSLGPTGLDLTSQQTA